MNGRLRCLVVAVLAASAVAVDATAAPSSVPPANQPASITPAPAGIRGRPYISSVVDLASRGYVEAEYLVSGVANTYPTNRSEPTTAPYTTRVIVRRPADRKPFNGTADVEWFNVTSQVDIDLDWGEGYRYLTRQHFAYVGVSAQQAGVQALKVWDPVRYGALSHPGDEYSFDIFAQVIAALRAGGPLMGPLRVKKVIASGHSQAGDRLHSYVESVQDQTKLVNGFLLRGDSTRSFRAEPSVPVLHYMTETEVTGVVVPASGSFRADSPHYRLWQFAGPAHNDNWSNTYWLNNEMTRDWASVPATWDEKSAGAYGEEGGVSNCNEQLAKTNEFPQRYTFDAALSHLDAWVHGRGAPPSMPRLRLAAGGTLARDDHGNAVGGIRYPIVDVPIATYSGEGGCPLSGWMKPFDNATLAALYPTHRVYVDRFVAAARRAKNAGVLLPFDYEDLIRRAERAAVPPA